jgi:predicted Zn finger-like uncharacterized protein
VIVTCEECSTSFQLDDARIPASGARVRCSRCKHAFFLPNPSSSQSQAIESVVAEAIQGKAGRAPAPTRDLPTAPAASAAAGRGEPEEEDWQFSQEIRVADDEDRDEDARERAGEPDPSSFDLTGDFGRGFDPEALASPEPLSPTPAVAAAPAPARSSRPKPVPAASSSAVAPAKSAAAKPAEPARDESSFGSIDDFSSLIDDDEGSLELATDPPSEAARPAARRPPAAADDLGDPESWDLVGGDEARHAQSTVAALVRPQKPVAKKKAASDSLDLFGDSELPPAREEHVDGPVAALPWAKVGKLVGWCVTAASVALVGGGLIHAEWARRAEVSQRLEVGPLVAETTRAGWLESSRAGFLLVFEGELRNTGSRPLASIPLRLALLDGAGERLAVDPIEAGERLPENVLREARPEELLRQRDQAVSGWQATLIAPGEVRRFAAIVPAAALPEGARRVLLESDPTAKP